MSTESKVGWKGAWVDGWPRKSFCRALIMIKKRKKKNHEVLFLNIVL